MGSVTISLEDFANVISDYQTQYDLLELQMKQFRPLALKVAALLIGATNHFEKTNVEAIDHPEIKGEESPPPESKGTLTPRFRRSPKPPKWNRKLEASQAKKLWAIDFHQAVGVALSDPEMLPSQPLDPDALNHLPAPGERMTLLVPNAPPSGSPTPRYPQNFKKPRPSIDSIPELPEKMQLSDRKKSLHHLPKEIVIVDEVGQVQSVESLVEKSSSPTNQNTLNKNQSSKSVEIDDKYESSHSMAPPLPPIPIEHTRNTEKSETTKITITPFASSSIASHVAKGESEFELAIKPERTSLPESKRESVVQRLKASATTPQYHPKGSLASIAASHKTVNDSIHESISFIRSICRNGIHPLSPFYLLPQVFTSVIYATELWLIPFSIGFELDLPIGYSAITSITHFIDCGLELLAARPVASAKLNETTLLSDWQRHYLTHGFAFDLITSIPFELFPVEHHTYLWVIKFLRLHKLFQILATSPIYKGNIRRVQKALRIGQAVLLILPLTLVFCYFLHFQACALFLMGRLAGFSNPDIVFHKDSDVSTQYTWALFAAVGNVFQVGYRPINMLEQWGVLSFIIIGAGMYASVIAAISSLAVSFDASGSLYRQKIDELQEYMHWKGLEDTTRQKILKYYDLKYRGKYFEEGTLLNDMNESLRMEISAHNCRDLISKVSFLRRKQNDGRDELFLGKIATALIPCYFVKGDILFTQGQPGSEMFFIQRGSVHVLVQGKHVATLTEGLFFGEIALIANIPRTATIQAASSCMLYRLTRTAFTSILEEFEDVKRTVDVIYRQRMEKIRIELEAKKLDVARDLASKVSFLNRCENDGKDEHFFRMIANSLEPVFLVAGDVIFQYGETGNEMYFVKNGTVDILVEGRVVTSLKNGSFFGELALIANIPRTASAHAVTTCHLYKLTRDAFMQIVTEFKDVRERIDVIYNERMLKVKRETITRLESMDRLSRSSSTSSKSSRM
ncbi:cyclic nucleotide-binding-like protein, partial [Obelidium mucronatum]